MVLSGQNEELSSVSQLYSAEVLSINRYQLPGYFLDTSYASLQYPKYFEADWFTGGSLKVQSRVILA